MRYLAGLFAIAILLFSTHAEAKRVKALPTRTMRDICVSEVEIAAMKAVGNGGPDRVSVAAEFIISKIGKPDSVVHNGDVLEMHYNTVYDKKVSDTILSIKPTALDTGGDLYLGVDVSCSGVGGL